LILTSALRHYARGHAARRGRVDDEDLRDIAAEKALELLRRFESGAWTLEEGEGAGLRGYLSTIARNGVLDLLKRRGRFVTLEAEEGEEAPATFDLTTWTSSAADPANITVRQGYVHGLRDCLSRLPVRNRRIWVLRVFYEMASRVIATHPEVGLTAPHVDVLLQRTRDQLRGCMQKKGLAPSEMPAGTLVELWRHVRPLPPSGEE